MTTADLTPADRDMERASPLRSPSGARASYDVTYSDRYNPDSIMYCATPSVTKPVML